MFERALCERPAQVGIAPGPFRAPDGVVEGLGRFAVEQEGPAAVFGRVIVPGQRVDPRYRRRDGRHPGGEERRQGPPVRFRPGDRESQVGRRQGSRRIIGCQGHPPGVAAERDLERDASFRDAVLTGLGRIESHKVSIAVMDFGFLAATMGSVVGEKITRAIERATAQRLPIIIVSASGGARMYEGMLSLMQMAKTCGALARHADAKLPYISVLTDPTTAGVMASYASVGDVIIAEPRCMIGFAGPRVIRETTHQELPPGFQTAEFCVEHGLVDMIVHRKKMKETLAGLLSYFGPAGA